jgi:hypothetical protein
VQVYRPIRNLSVILKMFVVRVQVKQMIAFIEQEAAEKAEEIDTKVS